MRKNAVVKDKLLGNTFRELVMLLQRRKAAGQIGWVRERLIATMLWWVYRLAEQKEVKP